MRLPDRAHTSRPWRIHELVPDFRLEDVWALPTPGRADEFPLLVEGFTTTDPARSSPTAARALWTLREKAGDLLHLDEPDTDPEGRVRSIRERLPEDLRVTEPPPFESLPFTPLYMTDDEFAAEVANRTVHGIIHLAWVRERTDLYRGQMAVYVKPNGILGSAYLAAIKPFRYLIVYPQLLRVLERRWEERPARVPK
jgi:uncharacterized protein DUF2867